MIRHGAGETLAGQNRRPEFADHRTKPTDIGVIREQFEGVIQTRAGLQEKGGSRVNVVTSAGLGRPESPKPEFDAATVPCLRWFDRQQPEILMR